MCAEFATTPHVIKTEVTSAVAESVGERVHPAGFEVVVVGENGQ
jgi:hypothetical protein